MTDAKAVAAVVRYARSLSMLAALAALSLVAPSACTKASSPKDEPTPAAGKGRDTAGTAGGAAPAGIRYARTDGERQMTAWLDARAGADDVRFTIRVTGAGCQAEYAGVAKAKDGDMESRDDDAGESHFVTEYVHESDACGVSVSVALEDQQRAWIETWDCKAQKPGCSLSSGGPLVRALAGASAGNAGASADLKAHTATFTALSAWPQAMPPGDAMIAEMAQRPVAQEYLKAHVCASADVECVGDGRAPRAFAGYRYQVSKQVDALVYYVVSADDKLFLLVTHDPAGKLLGSQIVAGDMDGHTYGYSGELTSARRIARGRFVWVDGDEREFVKDRSFEIRDDGRIDEVIR